MNWQSERAVAGWIRLWTSWSLTDEAVYPSSTRMFLAQLLMCLKRSGPNKMPPYHRDTTTITFRTSRICDETQTWNELGRDKYTEVWYNNAPWQQNISHQMWYSGWVCITCTWLSCQSKPDGLTLADDLHVFNRVSACLALIKRETSRFSSLNYKIKDSINQHFLLYIHE